MIDVVLGATHHLGGRYAHITSGTLRTITSVRPEHWQRGNGRFSLNRSTNIERLDATAVREIYLLEEVLLAEQLPVPGEALIVQLGVALAALQALRMPSPLQHLQYKAIQDQLVAAATLRYRCCG